MSTITTRLESRLAKLIAMPTVGTDTVACKAAIAEIAGELSETDLFISTGDSPTPWLMATVKDTKHPKLMLAAHLDIVAFSNVEQQQMSIKGDKLMGRGVFDMKFAIACFMELIDELSKKGELQNYDLGLMITTDEEVGFGPDDGVATLLKDGWRCDIALLPDAGREWKLESRAKGVSRFLLRSEGKSAHSSRPWEGENAVVPLMHALKEINDAYPVSSDPGAPTIAITTFTGGDAVNQIPQQASAHVEIRAFDYEEKERITRHIQSIVDKHNITLETIAISHGALLRHDHPLVQLFVAEVEALRGKPAEYASSLGATDASWFMPYDIPVIVMGPTGGGSHGPEEWMLRDDLVTFYKLTKAYTKKVAHATQDALVNSQ